MNRRTFFKLPGTAPLAPSVLAAMPVAKTVTMGIDLATGEDAVVIMCSTPSGINWVNYYNGGSTFISYEELLKKFREAYKNTKFRRPIV